MGHDQYVENNCDLTSVVVGPTQEFPPNHTGHDPPTEESWLLSSVNHPDQSVTIPQAIFKTYFQRDGLLQHNSSVPKSLSKALRSWSLANPGYKVHIFSLMDAKEYLRRNYHPAFQKVFHCIQAFAGKSNFFRMAILYREGGWYSDWKQVCLQPNLLRNISDETDFFASWDQGSQYGTKHHCVQNSFVGSKPRHPIVARTLELIMKNTQTMNYEDNNSLEATGTCVLGRAVKGFGKKFNTSVFGTHKRNMFVWKNESIVQHKCDGCGSGQDWKMGNNYNDYYNKRHYYCSDAPTIFLN
ncbi:hypothetical protein ACHAWF_014988 [Thalassiosira exigua]